MNVTPPHGYSYKLYPLEFYVPIFSVTFGWVPSANYIEDSKRKSKKFSSDILDESNAKILKSINITELKSSKIIGGIPPVFENGWDDYYQDDNVYIFTKYTFCMFYIMINRWSTLC